MEDIRKRVMLSSDLAHKSYTFQVRYRMNVHNTAMVKIIAGHILS